MQAELTKPVQSICVIGNSYVGAMFKAYGNRKDELPDVKIDFYTAAGRDFPLLDIVGNGIANVKFSNKKEFANISNYDAYFIYGDMLSTHGVIQMERDLTRFAYSRQVINCAIVDSINSSCTFKIYSKLKKITRAPIYILSHNILQVTKLSLSKEQYFQSISVIEKILGENIYHPFPEELFDEAFVPKELYYSGSVKLNGQTATEVAGHDRYHMNELGGSLILDSILKRAAKS